MACKLFAAALGVIVIASPAAANIAVQADASAAPAASEDSLYCLRVEATTGTRLETVQCWTRAQWADAEVDVDKDWAKEGVAVLDPRTGHPVTS